MMNKEITARQRTDTRKKRSNVGANLRRVKTAINITFANKRVKPATKNIKKRILGNEINNDAGIEVFWEIVVFFLNIRRKMINNATIPLISP